MSLKIIRTSMSLYEPIQNNQTWEQRAIYICKRDNGSSELYIEGENCGRFYDDTELQNKIINLQNEFNSIEVLSNIEIEALFNLNT